MEKNETKIKKRKEIKILDKKFNKDRITGNRYR